MWTAVGGRLLLPIEGGGDLRVVEAGEGVADLVPHAAELGGDKLRRARGAGGIVETDVQPPVHLAPEGGTGGVGAAAHGDDVVPLLVEVGVHVRRRMAAEVDADLAHGSYRVGIHPFGRFGAARTDFDAGIEGLQKAVRHLAAATVARAKNQYSHVNRS